MSFLFGLFFKQYFLLCLPGILGMVLLGINFIQKKYMLISRLIGLFLMYLALVLNFISSPKENLNETLSSWPSFVSLFVFFTISILFLIATFQKYVNATKR
ncbi:MAG: hypothetical protein EAZ13_08915 [Sphingobacteriia bacterium]|nr:MAG: hypothetical protein EAZ35_08210 [Sphingobacteriia bacterium]TAH06597.1 MAG: hypothetical protein EAZ13_08915 [Sphingobacteriia bacterium]